MFILPKNVKSIIAKFNEAGYEAYAVGGCVRDTLLGKEPQDWDITTSATPEEMKRIFPKTIDTGIQHGTVTVRMGGESYEVTTYRIDGEYEDGRHPKQVEFTASLREDLRRRDFTINAMAYSEKTGLVDLFNGVQDLEEKRIRAVGNPMERFSEDALRMLRALRFAAQLGFTIEDETKDAIRKLAPNLKKVSMERIHTEFLKLLMSQHPEELKVCYETELLKQFFPELDEAMKRVTSSEAESLMRELRECKADRNLRLALLFDFCCRVEPEPEKVCPQLATAVLKRWKLDGTTIRTTAHLVKYFRMEPERDPVQLRRYFSMVGKEYAEDVIALKEVSYGKSMVEEMRGEYVKTLQEGYCLSIKDLAITGADLLALGIDQGKMVGAYLQTALDYVLKEPHRNTKEALLAYLREQLKQ